VRSPVPGTTTAAVRAGAEMTASLDCILRPRRIAVIGASRTPNTIGNEIVSNLVHYGFTGTVFPVNPKADSINTLKAYPTIGAVPDKVDMAVITVPKQHVLGVARECGEAGVPGLTVISAGFREVGGEGVARERQLMEVVRKYGMRMVGPNCMGVLNADPALSMNATFAPSMPPFGRAAFVSQSGAMGLSVLDYAKEYGIGINQFVSMGNKPDVSGNDLLLHWEQDPTVGVVLMYVENFGNPRKFLEIARRMTRTKPIIVVKSGRSKVGARAASSHTGALAASDALVDAMLAQAGVIRAETVEELFDLAMAFSDERTPRSRRTAVVTNSGGPGILAADALERVSVELPELAPETVARLRPLFPEEASLRNPLDMIASATPPGYRAALDALLDDPNVDSAIAIFVPPLGIKQKDVAEAIASVAGAHMDKPVLAVLMGREGLPQGKAELHEVGVPAYIFPESAARALSALCRQREWMERPIPPVEKFNVDRETASRLLAEAKAAGQSRLGEVESLELLRAYGIPTAAAGLARNAEQAVALAAKSGGAVAMKIVSPEIVHKTDVGGVKVGVEGAVDVRAAYDEIVASARRAVPDANIHGVLVQEMVHGGRETIAGVTRDPSFGPLVMFGLGGIFVEVLRDVIFRVAPINRHEAADMISGLRGSRLLGPVRGAPPADRQAIEEILLRLSLLAEDFPQIAELDVNPLLAFPDRAVAVDGRVLLSS
jgi:acetyl coenzyme A synthetase (ADP forming)-like protein